MRNLSKSLDSENLIKAGLPAFIKFQLEMIEKTGVYTVQFRQIGEEKKLEASREIIIYRIVQEALNNIIKHAKAKVISILVNYLADNLVIEISDDGNGFDNSTINVVGIYAVGAGLRNMKKRAELIHASFEINRVSLKGTAIHLKIPIDHSERKLNA